MRLLLLLLLIMPKIALSPINAAADWTVTGTGSVSDINEPYYSHSHVEGQVFFNLEAGDVARLTLAAPVPLQDFENLSLALCEPFPALENQSPDPSRILESLRDTPLRLRVISAPETIEYLVPLCPGISRAEFAVEVDSLDGIEFVATAPVRFAATDLIAYTQDHPLDIADAVAELIRQFPIRRLVCGTASAVAGQRSVTIENQNFIDDGRVVRVGDSLHRIQSKRHDGQRVSVTFSGKDFDGDRIVSDYTGEITVALPVVVFPKSRLSVAPGIAIHDRFSDETIPEDDSLLRVYDSFRSDLSTCRETSAARRRIYTLLVYGPFDSLETMAMIRDVFGDLTHREHYCFINGLPSVATFESVDLPDGDDLGVGCKINVQEAPRWHRIRKIGINLQLTSSPR